MLCQENFFFGQGIYSKRIISRDKQHPEIYVDIYVRTNTIFNAEKKSARLTPLSPKG
jgi:hypothetical protein